jgi:hypothetical protein
MSKHLVTKVRQLMIDKRKRDYTYLVQLRRSERKEPAVTERLGSFGEVSECVRRLYTAGVQNLTRVAAVDDVEDLERKERKEGSSE